jgi:mono/diheme cytochrome c family protein
MCPGKYYLSTLAFLFSLFLFSCQAEKPNTSLLNANNLTSFYVRIDPAQDMKIRTPKGATINIRKGTFDKVVELEIKEAYTMSDILLGGLITESNSEPLISGGMVYINAKDRQQLVPKLPINISIPTAYVNTDMQVFKGEEKEDGTINWVNPDTLPVTPQTAVLEEGRSLFQQNCQTCHALDKNLTGPSLRGFTQRGPWRNRQAVYNWIHNPAAFMARDRYTQDLKQQYGVVMQAFPALTNRQIDVVIAYLNNEEGNLAADEYDGSYTYTTPVNQLCTDTQYIFREQPLNDEPTTTFDTLPSDTSSYFESTESAPAVDLRGGFTDKPTSGAYEFEIKTLGWYNVDAYMKGLPGTFPCVLSVQVNGETIVDLKVYVFFPRHKDLSVGSQRGNNWFYFEKSEGKMPMFLGTKGIVLAFGSKGEQLYIGKGSFYAKPSQQIKVDLQPTTEEAFLQLVKKGNIEGIDFKLNKAIKYVSYNLCDQDTSKAGAPGAITN